MEEQLLLLENPLLKVLLLEDERSDWVNPIFDEREKCGEFHTLFPMLLEQAQFFFQNFRNVTTIRRTKLSEERASTRFPRSLWVSFTQSPTSLALLPTQPISLFSDSDHFVFNIPSVKQFPFSKSVFLQLRHTF